MIDKNDWAVPGWTDEYGNVKCKKCGSLQSPGRAACAKCCPHNTLKFVEDWHGYGYGWQLAVECADCGKWDLPIEKIIREYKAVKK